MCISPESIKNPSYGLEHLRGLKDVDSQYIRRPCGYCSECIAVKQMGFIQRLQMEETKNHLFFVTLTYDNEHLPQVGTSSGYFIKYADISHVQKMFKRLRKLNPIGRPLRYFGVSELGSKGGRPHFHLIIFVPKVEEDTYEDVMNMEYALYWAVRNDWRINVGCTRAPKYEPLFTYAARWIRGKFYTNYDLHYVHPGYTEDGVSNVGWYVLKYMLKPSDRVVRLQRALRLNLSEEEYHRTWSLVRPRCFYSKGFGLNARKVDGSFMFDPDIIDKLHRDAENSVNVSEYPLYCVPGVAKTFPLSRYYKNKGEIFPAALQAGFYLNHKDVNPLDRDKTYSQLITKLYQDEKKVSQTFAHDALDDVFDELCDA